jgi:hypothetical protein
MAAFGAISFVVFVVMLFLRLANPFGWPDDPWTAASKANGTYPYAMTLSLSVLVGLFALLAYEVRKLAHAKQTLARLQAELTARRELHRARLRELRFTA